MSRNYVALALGVAATLLGTGLSYWALKASEKEVFVDLIPIFAGFFLFFVVDRFVIYEMADEIKNKQGQHINLLIRDMQELRAQIGSAIHFRPISVDEGNRIIEDLVGVAVKVRNTVFYYSASDQYLTEKVSIVSRYVHQNSVDWQECVYWKPRVDQIAKKISELGIPKKGAYQVWQLEDSVVPRASMMADFVTIEKRDGTQIVMFGWADEPGESYTSRVFYCEHPDVVKLFIGQFRRLRDLGAKIHS